MLRVTIGRRCFVLAIWVVVSVNAQLNAQKRVSEPLLSEPVFTGSKLPQKSLASQAKTGKIIRLSPGSISISISGGNLPFEIESINRQMSSGQIVDLLKRFYRESKSTRSIIVRSMTKRRVEGEQEFEDALAELSKTYGVDVVFMPSPTSFVLPSGIEAFSPSPVLPKKQTIPPASLNNLVNSVVEVDGLIHKRSGTKSEFFTVLPWGKIDLLYVDGSNANIEGQAFRISGVLRKTTRKPTIASKAILHTPTDETFQIEAFEILRIESPQNTKISRSPFDWIAPGLLSEAASRMIQSHRYSPYPLALTASSDGSVPRSYRVDDQNVLYYRELNGRVTSVTRVKLNAAGKSDDEYQQIAAYKLPNLHSATRPQNSKVKTP